MARRYPLPPHARTDAGAVAVRVASGAVRVGRAPRPTDRALAIAIAVVAVALPGVASAAPASAGLVTEPVTVVGTIGQVITEAPHADAGPAGTGDEHADDHHGPHAPTDEPSTTAVVEVDGVLHALPDDVAARADVERGDAVEITVDVPTGGSVEDALAGLSTSPAAPVEIVRAGTQEAAVATAVQGARTLTVLPVSWGPRDSATRESLTTVASQTAAYWAEQSGGRVTVQPAVRDWTTIPAPERPCDTYAMLKSALAAHPDVAVGGRNHVLIYFPAQRVCGGWAGQAQVGGPVIWVNGAPLLDVFAHELGHNFGLGHADRLECETGGVRTPLSTSCTRQEYGDYADVMGVAMPGRPTGSLNAGLADALGLATVRAAPATGGTVVDLAPPPPRTGTAVRALKIPTSEGTLYVDFRPAVGRDLRIADWAGVQVHLRTVDRLGAATTALLDMQPAAAPFASPQMLPRADWVVPGTGRVLRVTAVDGARARVELTPVVGPQTAPAPQVARYVRRVYADLFGREVDPTGLASWTTALDAGTPRVAVANGITSSWEYRAQLIDGSYRRYLDRGPDPTGAAGWQDAMARGWTVSQIESGFVASAEYHTRAGGTDAAWVRALYADVLDRAPGTAEVDAWVATLGRGASRQGVAMGFLLSTEHLSGVVDGHYRHLLRRGIDPTGQATWVAALQAGGRDEAIIGGIVASPEYYAGV